MRGRQSWGGGPEEAALEKFRIILRNSSFPPPGNSQRFPGPRVQQNNPSMDLLWHGKDQTRPAGQHCGIWGFCSARRGWRSPGETPNIIKGWVTSRAQSPQGMANPIQNPLTFSCGFHGSEAGLGLSCETASAIRDRRSRLALLHGSTKGGRRAKACPQPVLCSGIKHKVLGSWR